MCSVCVYVYKPAQSYVSTSPAARIPTIQPFPDVDATHDTQQ